MTNRKLLYTVPFFVIGVVVVAIYAESFSMSSSDQEPDVDQIPPNTKLETATFGTGCFWCTEAVFQQLKGVHSVVSGYTGGHVENPTYKQICTGTTGHAEVVQIQFDPRVIAFKDLLEVFWKTHDPTTLNRQGADVGPQYRSAVFFHSEEQKKLAERYKQELDSSGAFEQPIVTEITESSTFYPAEDYHQNYFNLNGSQPYCSFVIRPKLEKFEQAFSDKLKKKASGK
ncbi:MAG: peptide-methionine (S)-S-oxide reductase MsrA [Pirellulales bacterium]|nr:peptide-methionine (S)-S-oxide reductase MsrA [Pirellulales bacterium]